MLTDEWEINPLRVRVAVAAQARREAYALWAELAASLDVLTSDILRGDAMGLNFAGGALSVQAQALEYGIPPAEVVQAARGTASYFSAMASETTAAGLDIRSNVTGKGDGLAMTIAGGSVSVQEQATKLGVTANDVAARGTASYFSAMAGETTAAGSDIR